MRIIDVKEITENIKEMCIEANHVLAPDMRYALQNQAILKHLPTARHGQR